MFVTFVICSRLFVWNVCLFVCLAWLERLECLLVCLFGMFVCLVGMFVTVGMFVCLSFGMFVCLCVWNVCNGWNGCLFGMFVC